MATTSTTSTTAQSSGARTGSGYNALAKAEQKVAKQQKGMARQMPGMSLENQDQPLAGGYNSSKYTKYYGRESLRRQYLTLSY